MNIIIIGCGKVGAALAEQLNEQGSNITVIDLSAERLGALTAKCDVMSVNGNGAAHSVQQEAGIEAADMMIAVTGSDELNLLCCLIARKAGSHCRTIARVRNPQYSREAPFLKDELGLAMVINPEYAAASEIARVLRFPSAIKIETFGSGRVELIKLRLPENCPLVGLAVKQLSAKLGCDVLVCTIERGDDAFIANGNFVFEERDVISIVASPKKANDFFRKINYKTKSVKDAMIVGGGEIGHYLTDMLVKDGISVKLVEKDLARCDELSTLWDDVTVINGDASDQETLMESGLQNAGAFVALTNLDEENILLSLFAHSVSSAKLVTKINRIDFEDVIKHLDLDTIIYPKNITADNIVRYVRSLKNTLGSNVESLHQIIKGKVEAAEFAIKENSSVTETPLMELKLKPGILLAAILRGENVVIPRGSDVIKTGDTVIIVSNQMGLHDITDILK